MRQRLLQSDPRAFTLVELMLVVVIVAILALVAVVTYSRYAIAAKMSEGITGVDIIRTAIRAHAVAHNGKFPPLANATGAELTLLNLGPTDLNGKYFKASNYSVTSTADNYTIRATLFEDARYWYEIKDDGTESKSY